MAHYRNHAFFALAQGQKNLLSPIQNPKMGPGLTWGPLGPELYVGKGGCPPDFFLLAENIDDHFLFVSKSRKKYIRVPP